MIRRLVLTALLLAAAQPLFAGQVTKKYDFAPSGGIQDVNVEVDKVNVNSIVFKLDPQGLSAILSTKAGDAGARVRVDNNGYANVEVGIAIVLFDADGNIVGAGAGGTKVGFLRKGSRDTHQVQFDYVYRNLDKVKSFTITLETQPKVVDKK